MATGGSFPTRLYTRTGDRGDTGLAGGARVAKESPRIRAFGSLDELGATLGLAAARLPESARSERDLVTRLQHEVFVAMSELAAAPGGPAPAHRIETRHVVRLEQELDRYTAALLPLTGFVLARGEGGGAELHLARTVARRSERELWALHREEPVRAELASWLNRLSDLLFALALTVNRSQHVVEISPDYAV